VTKLKARQLRWADVTISERVDFFGGRAPSVGGCWLPKQGRYESDWPTWTAYLTDWATVREDALAEWEAHHSDLLAHFRAEVTRRAAELREVEAEGEAVGLATRLLEEAAERLAEEEARELPAAEIQYQRAVRGEDPGYEMALQEEES
jgi:hypothetical protein